MGNIPKRGYIETLININLVVPEFGASDSLRRLSMFRAFCCKMGLWRAEKPAREKKTMKKIALAIAFAVASMPLTFAAQTTPANPPASGAGQSTTKKAVKKHAKKSTKKTETTKSAAVSK